MKEDYNRGGHRQKYYYDIYSGMLKSHIIRSRIRYVLGSTVTYYPYVCVNGPGG